VLFYPHNKTKTKGMFDTAKKLYDSRSTAVHGANLKVDTDTAVERSEDIPPKFIIECIYKGSTPKQSDLVPQPLN
jgi:predicted choloylglycine hydrolase